METMVDLFRNSLFESTSLTQAINLVPYVPQRISQLGLFTEAGVATTSVVIERLGTTLALIPTSPRGAPGTPMQGDKRDGVSLRIPRLAATAQLHADEVQNVRSFGSSNQLAGVTEKRDEKLRKMSLSQDLTLEYHRLGAVQGVVLDSDGATVLYDLFDTFDITERAEVAFNLSAAWVATDGGVIRQICAGIIRDMREDLGGLPLQGVHALVGDAFWDDLIGHPEIFATYLNQQAANAFRESNPFESFRYGGITWENYRGSGSVAVATDKARFFPVGVPGLFETYFGPADYMEAVNTIGLPKYAKAVMDASGFDRYIMMESQSNPLNICTRPRVLRKGKRGA